MNEIVLEDKSLRVTVGREDNSLWVELEDRAAGKRWGRSPLMTLEVHAKSVRTVDLLGKYRIDRFEKTDGGVHIIVGDAARSISVGLWLRVVDGELSVLLSPAEVYERDGAMYRVFAIDVLPGLMRTGDGGRLVLPINTGVLCDPAGKPERSDRFLIYGEQERWELVPTMPLCAAHSSDGGLLALAVQGACDAECRVATDGGGGGQVGFAFSLRRYWPDPVDVELREFRFCPIPPRADPVTFVAKRLRRHIVDDLGKPTLAQRAEQSPAVDYLLGAYIMKLFHGVENVGAMMDGQDKADPVSFRNVMTFAEAGENLQRLHDAGVTRIVTQSVGWNLRGHDGMYPTRFPVEPRLGGEEGFRKLITLGNSLGFHMNVHDNYMMNVPHSPDWEADLVIQDIYGEPLVHGCWGGGIEYAGWPLALPDERLGGHMERVKDLGARGMTYIDYMEQPLEVNYHPKHGGPRSDHARGVVRILEEAKRHFGSVETELGFLPATVAADCVASLGEEWHLRLCRPEWPITSLLDRRVPIFPLAIHGLTLLEHRHGLRWRNAMEAVLFGEHPRDEWSARAGVMPVLDDDRIGNLKRMFDLVLVRFGRLQTLEMTGYEQPADGVERTEFADGTEVTADFNEERLLVNREEVPRPEGF